MIQLDAPTFCVKFKSFLLLTIFNILVRYSIHITNSSGETRSPCQSPFFPIIFPYNPPLITTIYQGVDMQAMIHLMNLAEKFKAYSISNTNSHSTKSYAFRRSIFIRQLFVIFFLLYSLTRSWHISMFCTIVLPVTKALQFSEIMYGSIFLSLLYNIFQMTLYTVLQHAISR